MQTRVSLRWRLLGLGLASAMLTALTGGAGILSLRTINSRMQETTTNVRATIAGQNAQIEQFVDLRSVVTEVVGAANRDEVDRSAAKLARLEDVWTIRTAPGDTSVLATAADLVRHRAGVLATRAELDSLRRAAGDALARINGLALKIADDIEFDAVLNIAEAMDTTRQNLALLREARRAGPGQARYRPESG